MSINGKCVIVLNRNKEWIIDYVDKACFITTNIDDLIDELNKIVEKKVNILIDSDKETFKIIRKQKSTKKTIAYEIKKIFNNSENLNISYQKIENIKDYLILWIENKELSFLKARINKVLNKKIFSHSYFYLFNKLQSKKINDSLVIKISNNYLYGYYYHLGCLNKKWIVKFDSNNLWEDLPDNSQRNYLMEEIIEKLLKDEKSFSDGINKDLLTKKLILLDEYMKELVFIINHLIKIIGIKDFYLLKWSFNTTIFNKLIKKYKVFINCQEVSCNE